MGGTGYHLKKKVCHPSQDQDTFEVLIMTLGKHNVGQKQVHSCEHSKQNTGFILFSYCYLLLYSFPYELKPASLPPYMYKPRHIVPLATDTEPELCVPSALTSSPRSLRMACRVYPIKDSVATGGPRDHVNWCSQFFLAFLLLDIPSPFEILFPLECTSSFVMSFKGFPCSVILDLFPLT